MTNYLQKFALGAVFAAFSVVTNAKAAMAASFTFTQGGYNLGSTLSGSFTGEDLIRIWR